MYYCCGLSEKGNMSHNEDALLIGRNVVTEGAFEAELKAPFIAAVSDGVSGELSGEVASAKCMEYVSAIRYNSRTDMARKLTEVHRQLAVDGCGSMNTLNMQCTFCGVAIDENEHVELINVGDSRLYRFRGGRLRQLSRDQSLVQRLIDEGSITKEEAKNHARKNVIFPVLGNVASDPTIDIEEIEGGLKYGDILLLCTDGLSDCVPEMDIEEILDLPKSLPMRLERLVRRALERGSHDNITIAAIVYLP